MEISEDEIYIQTTYVSEYWSITVVQDSHGELIELQIEQYYD